MKKICIILFILFSVISVSSCSKKASPTAPVDAGSPVLNMTLTYIATAGATAQAVATQTMEIQQTATTVAAAQKTANAESTAAAVNGSNTPTINATATAENINAAATATAQMAVTLTYLAGAGAPAQAAATLTQTIATGNATATVAAQKTANALVTAIVVTPSYTYTPAATMSPTNTCTPTPSSTPAPLPITINAYIYVDDYETPDFYYNVTINDANLVPITNAVITVKNTTKSIQFPATCVNGNYSGIINNTDPGNSVEMDVYFGGVTYTAGSVLPGGAQLDPDGNMVTWQYGGDTNQVSILDPGGNNIFNQYVSGANIDISSDYPGPGVSGQYSVDLDITKSVSFNGGVTPGGNLQLEYDTSWDVNVILDSKYPLPTPTPAPATTAPAILAEIFSSDIESGVVVQDIINITDSSGNAVTNAGVTVKNITAGTQVNAVYSVVDMYDSGYYVNSGANCVPGNTYEVDVCVNGITYTAQATAPVTSGNLSADCDTLTWQNSGNYNYVAASDEIYKFNAPGNSMDVSSIYSSSGVYEVDLMLANVYSNGGAEGYPANPGIFAGAAYSSMLAIGFQYGWDVEITF